jgi:hypothetical protein
MKRAGCILWCWMAAVSWGYAADARFFEAAAAYDQGDYAGAAARYEQLLDDGWRAPELFYNLGNAYWRQGDAGRAVLNYRRAQQLAPRDADIRHNLDHALRESGALVAEARWPARWWLRVSRAEWRVVTVAAWWLTAGLLCGAALARRRRGWLLPLGVSGLLWLAGAVGWLHWEGLRRRPEVVVLVDGLEVRFAPLERSTPHFVLPMGSIGRIASETEGWYRVRIGEQDGWIPHSSVGRVSPGKAQRNEAGREKG